MVKYTAEDIKRLAQSFRNAKDRNKPFSLLTGAGCSLSAGIPLAPDLVKKIHEHYAEQVKRQLPTDRQDDYGSCMGCLTPSERRDILKPYLDGANVNWGHIAVAAMMDKGWISRVLTFNFDQVLARSCGICGHYPAVYDFGVAPSATLDYLVTPCIVHLHGQGYGLALLNSEEETQIHAEKIEPLILDTLERYPLLIVGYSGKADAVFPKLLDNFRGRERLIWVEKSEDPNDKMTSLTGKVPKTSEFLGGADADVFLIELARELGCWPPVLFTSFEDHLLQEIKSVLDYPMNAGGGEDLVSDLRKSLERTKIYRKANADDKFDNLMLLGKWEEVIKRASEAKSNKEKSHLAWAYTLQGNALSDTAASKQSEGLFRESINNYEKALNLKTDMHEALNNWGNALLGLARLKQDEKLFHESFAKYAAALKIKPDKHEALVNWGNALSSLAKQMQRKELYLESFAKYEAALAVKPDDHGALNNWSGTLCSLWHLTHEPFLLERAQELAEKSQTIRGMPSYNLGCVLALRDKEDQCRSQLLRCKDANTLPNAAHLSADIDLAEYRDRDWFKDLLAGKT